MRKRLALALSSCLLLAGCATPSGSSGGAVVECSMTPNTPGESGNVSGLSTVYLHGGYFLQGQVWVQCDTPPERHVVTLTLQRWIDGWTTVEYDSISLIPSLYWSPRSVVIKCVPGQYRLGVGVEGLSSTGTPFDVTEMLATVNIHDVMCQDNPQELTP